jgi:hypothetical protein
MFLEWLNRSVECDRRRRHCGPRHRERRWSTLPALEVLESLTFPSFSAPVIIDTGLGPAVVTVADVNGDGIPDLVMANSNDGTVGVLLGNGDGTLHTGPRFGVGRGPSALVVGDFNRAGRLGLAVANTDSNNVSVLVNDGVWTGPRPGPDGGGRSPGANPKPRTHWASPALRAEDVGRLGPCATTMEPSGATGPMIEAGRPLLDVNAGVEETRGAVADVSIARTQALVRVERATGPRRERFFAEPENGWLWDYWADELRWLEL